MYCGYVYRSKIVIDLLLIIGGYIMVFKFFILYFIVGFVIIN